MKKLLFSIALFTFVVALSGCYGMKQKGISGTLEVNRKSGWSTLDFKDAKTGNPFSLESGQYTLDYENGVYGYRLPMILVKNKNGVELGRIAIPRNSVNSDGSFEIFSGAPGNTNSFNILGSVREVIKERRRFAVLRAACTYQVASTCVVTNAKGEMTIQVCMKDVSGVQDQVWEDVKFQNLFRILFDGQDLMNVAVFRGDSGIQSEKRMVTSESCH